MAQRREPSAHSVRMVTTEAAGVNRAVCAYIDNQTDYELQLDRQEVSAGVWAWSDRIVSAVAVVFSERPCGTARMGGALGEQALGRRGGVVC
jgi:hypothetical protein